jgi:hypothetical protein
MSETLNTIRYVFNPTLVHKDLEDHQDLWEAVVYEHKSSGLYRQPKRASSHTMYFIVPAMGREALLMQLASRWYPGVLIWKEPYEQMPFHPPQELDKFLGRHILLAMWGE